MSYLFSGKLTVVLGYSGGKSIGFFAGFPVFISALQILLKFVVSVPKPPAISGSCIRSSAGKQRTCRTVTAFDFD